jgi:hypothetical protein
MRRALAMTADLVEHLVSMVSVKSAGEKGEVRASKELPLPFNATAFNDANGLFALLAYFARMWADRISVPGPSLPPRVWRDASGRVVGLPVESSPASARSSAGVLASWLSANLEAICWQHAPDVEFMHDELRTVFTIAARWPVKEKPHYSPMPCPTDGGIVGIFPATLFGQPERFICDRCGREFETDEYQAYVRAYLSSREKVGTREAKQQLMISERTRQHLLAKYGSATRRAKGA